MLFGCRILQFVDWGAPLGDLRLVVVKGSVSNAEGGKARKGVELGVARCEI